MTVTIVSRNDGVAPETRQYAQEKGEKLFRFFSGITKLEVVLGRDGVECAAELVLHLARGEPITAHCRHETMNGAIDLAVDQARRSLVRYKEKLRNHHARGTVPGPEEPPPRRDDKLESYQEIIEKTDFES